MISSSVYFCLESTDQLIKQVVYALKWLLSLFSTPPPPPPKPQVWSMQFVYNYTKLMIKSVTSQLTISNSCYLYPPALIALCLVFNVMDMYRFSRALPFVRTFYNYKQGYFIVNSLLIPITTLPLQVYVCFKFPQLWLTTTITTINFSATIIKLVVMVYCRKYKHQDLKYEQSDSFPLYSKKRHFCGLIYLTLMAVFFHVYKAKSYDFLDRVPAKYSVINWASYGTLVNVCFIAKILIQPAFSTEQKYLQHSYSISSKASLEPALFFMISLYSINSNKRVCVQFTWYVIELTVMYIIAFHSILAAKISEIQI